MMNNINFEEITLRKQISSRGGGIEIDLTTLGFEGEKMAAYQNYLGGGLLGSICVNDTIRRQTLTTDEESTKKLDDISEQLMRYLHELTNPEDEWAQCSFEELEQRPASAY